MILRWTPAQLAFMRDASSYGSRYYEKLWDAIRALLPDTPGHICDAGCGAGYLSLQMAKHCGRVTAIDLSQPATDLLRENAAGLDNLTVKTGDINTLPPETPYDAMVFCYFGRTPDILKIAKAQCRGTLIMVTRDYETHRFSLNPTCFDRDTVSFAKSVLNQAGIGYDYAPCELEFGQPFRSLDAAAEFFTLYGGKEAGIEDVLPKLQKTGDPAFPYYLPSTKKMGIFAVQTSQL